MGIDKGNTTSDVLEFDSIYGIQYPGVSGQDGGGNEVHWNYNVQATPTVIVITPDKLIATHQIYPPNTNNIVDSVLAAGGIQQSCMTNLPDRIQAEDLFSIGPNPFSSKINITINLKKDRNLEIAILNITGQQIYSLEAKNYGAGIHHLNTDISAQAEGFYFVQVRQEGQVIHTRKMVLLR